MLQVATALHLGAAEFLSGDASQGKLAGAEGLTPKPEFSRRGISG